jgi:hypothetical protein
VQGVRAKTVNPAERLDRQGKLVRKATGNERKKLKPRYPAIGLGGREPSFPAAIRTYH